MAGSAYGAKGSQSLSEKCSLGKIGPLSNHETPRAHPGLSGSAVALDCGTHVRLAPSLAATEQRLQGRARHHRNMDQDYHDPPDGEASHSQSVTFSDRLLEGEASVSAGHSCAENLWLPWCGRSAYGCS